MTTDPTAAARRIQLQNLAERTESLANLLDDINVSAAAALANAGFDAAKRKTLRAMLCNLAGVEPEPTRAPPRFTTSAKSDAELQQLVEESEALLRLLGVLRATGYRLEIADALEAALRELADAAAKPAGGVHLPS